MSGTSLDGVDAVLADFSTARPTVIGHTSAPIASALKNELLALNSSGEQELHRAALAANALVRLYAQQVQALLKKTHVSPMQVRAIGAHGQTVRHRPSEFDGTGYTLQLNQPALLAELCGIDVVADFRSRDVAAGGQGAPLVPPFHQAFFGNPSKPIAVLNIGGISNLTLIHPQGQPTLSGFDCGPGNALMDAWCLAHTGAAFDDAGRWAAQGVVQPSLLASMKAEPFFSKPPPKSTGRDLFNSTWLAAQLRNFDHLAAQDVQATLTELTAQACADCLLAQSTVFESLVVCGGGAFNSHLMARLQAALPAACRVSSSAQSGLPPLQVEATAFAWLARQAVLRQASSLPSVTGAKGARILGAIYPA
jgi:anhydro-N-acetylmuramic acid kinase